MGYPIGILNFVVLLFLMQIVSYDGICHAQNKLLPSFTNNALLNTTSFSDYGSNATARIVPFPGIDIHNASCRFYPAFVNFSEGKFAFSILMRGDGNVDSSMKIIWTANHGHAAHEDALIAFTPDGTLILWDSDGSAIWSSPTSGTDNATSFSLGIEGCLSLFNTTGFAVWRSCENPTDGLLIGQPLLHYEKLTSQIGTSAARGLYSLVMASSGLAMYFAPRNDSPQPYWVWGAYGNDSFSVSRSCNQSMAMELQWQADYRTLQVVLFPDNSNSSSNYTEFCSDFSASTENQSWVLAKLPESVFSDFYPAPPAFLRLDPDGNLRLYVFLNLSWKISWEAISDKCLLPHTCGEYGVCRDGGTCDGCPLADSGQTMKAATKGCSPTFPPSCTSNGTMQMLTLTGVDYFAMAYLNKTTVSSLGECKNLCFNICSCAASFYCSAASYCVIMDDIQGNLRYTGDSRYVAFLKLDERDVIAKDSNSSSAVTGGIIAGMVVSAVALCICTVGALLFFFRLRGRKRAAALIRPTDSNSDYSDEDGMQLINLRGAARFSYAELELATKGFEERLGRGGFGSVYRGVLQDGRAVAVKRLEEGASSQGQREFYTEVATLSSLHHWNLVQLYGFCVEKSERLLVYEYCPNSSLDKWLFQARQGSPRCLALSWRNRYQIAIGVAKGLTYLHTGCHERIVHLDIKPQNILLDRNFEAKVADFGLSRLMGRDQTHLVTTIKGTPGYVAPEWLLDSLITDKNDVYSYGLVMLELVSGRCNYLNPRELQHNAASLQNDTGADQYYYFPAHALRWLHEGRQAELVDPRIGLNHDPAELLKLVKVGLLCVQEEASKRPRMECVVQMLEGDMEIPNPPWQQNLHMFLEAHLRLLHPNNNDHNNSSRGLSLNSFSFGTPSRRSFTRLNNDEDETMDQIVASDLVVVYSEVSTR